MDMRMPEMTGAEAARLIREIKGPQELPIIIMSGDFYSKNNEDDEVIFNATLQKPFRAEAMYETVMSVLNN
jgi:CheY-like chemotaxis protein